MKQQTPIITFSGDSELINAIPEEWPRCLLEEAASMGWPRVQLVAELCAPASEPRRISARHWVDVSVESPPLNTAATVRVLSCPDLAGLYPDLQASTVQLRRVG